MLSVTADTNVYISALNFPRGAPMLLLRMAQDQQIRLDISQEILDETLGVLRRKFQWAAGDLQEAESLIISMTNLVAPTKRLDAVKSDPTDNRILECADAAGSDVIISGDKHLLRLREHGGKPIMKVAEFIQLAQGQGR